MKAAQNVLIRFNTTAVDHEHVKRELKNTLHALGFRAVIAGNEEDKDIYFERDLTNGQ